MAFPTVESVTTTLSNSATNSHTINLPATVNSGDLLIAVCRVAGTVNSNPAGWTVLLSHTISPIYILNAAGTEGGGTITIGTSSSSTANVKVIRVTGWIGDVNEVYRGTQATGSSDSPNPPSASTGEGTEDNLFIAAMVSANFGATVSSYPSNYTNGEFSINTSSVFNGVGVAFRELAAESDDPGVFTMGGSVTWAANTIIVRPGAGGVTHEFAGSETVSFDGTAAMVQTATFTDSQTVSFDGTAAMIQTAAFTGAETVSMDGTAALKQTANLTGAETVSFDGSIGTVQIEHHFEGAETVSFDGTADTVLNHWLMDGAQSVSFDGSAALKQTATLTGGETVSFDGTAALDIAAIAFDGQGVLSFDGSIATLNLILEMEAAAAVSFDGEAALGQQALFEGAATLSFDGIAALTGFQWDPVETPASTTWSDVD